MIDTLCLQGGGVKDIVMIGALNVLKDKGILANINKFAGTSAGSIICTLLSIGYSPDEIENSVFSQNSSIVQDPFYKLPFNLFFNYGLYSGDKMILYIENMFIQKNLDINITFSELHKYTNNILVLTGTSLNTMNTFYFNYHTTPDLPVIKALRMSISIPFYFTSVKQKLSDKTHVMVDGGVLENFPIYYFKIVDDTGKYISTSSDIISYKNKNKKVLDCSNVIGIMFLDNNETANVASFYNGFNIINNLTSFITILIDTVLLKIQKDNFTNPITGYKSNFFNNIIAIPMPFHVNAVNFNLDKHTKNLLVQAGVNCANSFFRKKEIQIN